jgi:hypothetical protein
MNYVDSFKLEKFFTNEASEEFHFTYQFLVTLNTTV